ncbi:hypothetical protein R6V09_43945 [Streptomyces sp. W16]|uniref:hypothetical protein n=1 Tax=Streptomyces sp. W16 TaxID=3076631 RepID=UPI00295C0224|nr:hypothetical protein [Streptomyces sp. W16]MDV9177068.1 hypothetical protein [Streptomyces sp. W16]
MGSMRNPVGPLPSSIYWRRRVLMVSVVALLALLITWIVTSGGGGSKNGADGAKNGRTPAPTITAGPSGSGPAISQHPGGRDESSSGSSSGGSGSSGGASDGSSGGGSGSGSGAGDGGSGGGANGGSSTGTTVPADSTLPNCTASAVQLSLRSLHNSYSPGQTPTFVLTAKNSSSSDCKVDLGPKSAVLTITEAGGAADYWSSADCPKGSGSVYYRVSAGGSVTYTLKWDRKPSAPECATPPAGSAGVGTYLVEAAASGFAKAQTSFVLASD